MALYDDRLTGHLILALGQWLCYFVRVIGNSDPEASVFSIQKCKRLRDGVAGECEKFQKCFIYMVNYGIPKEEP